MILSAVLPLSSLVSGSSPKKQNCNLKKDVRGFFCFMGCLVEQSRGKQVTTKREIKSNYFSYYSEQSDFWNGSYVGYNNKLYDRLSKRKKE